MTSTGLFQVLALVGFPGLSLLAARYLKPGERLEIVALPRTQ